MVRAVLVCLVSIAVAGCLRDESISGFAASGTTYHLVSLDGQAFDAPATLRFPQRGRIAGNAPCNSYNAEQSVPYPWFEIGPILSTRRVCPQLAEETAYLTALTQMSLAEVSGSTLILSNDAGREMVFEGR